MKYLVLFLAVLLLTPFSRAEDHHEYEQQILQASHLIQEQRFEEALTKSQDILKAYPTSKTAQLMVADLMLAQIQPITEIGAGLNNTQAQHDLKSEFEKRWKHRLNSKYKNLVPANVLKIAENQPYIMIADMTDSRIFVFKNEQGLPVYERDFFMSIGSKGFGKQLEGDLLTPIGVYHYIDFIKGEKLPDLYGKGAFPVNYPNNWDRKNKRTGNGIWLHGTPSYTYNRPPLASEGCFVVSNDDFLKSSPYISTELKTPVLLVDKIDWVDSLTWQQRQQSMLQTFSQWQTDWESLNHDKFMSHYSKQYFVDGRDYKNIYGHKKWVNRKKEFIKMEYSNLNIYQYPGEKDLRLMEYVQNYQSNNYNSISEKELYWKKESDGQWRIIFENS